MLFFFYLADSVDEDHESFNELEQLEEKEKKHHGKANKLRYAKS